MRKLAKKEIDDAPDWAVSYCIEVVKTGPIVAYHERHYGFTLPLPSVTPRKEFNISEYLELDPEHACQWPVLFVDGLNLIIDGKVSKFHAIGIAKHFKLTMEDLK